ncbi:hypothetical protein WA577_003178 [Blastocystis sp. JDR]
MVSLWKHFDITPHVEPYFLRHSLMSITLSITAFILCVLVNAYYFAYGFSSTEHYMLDSVIDKNDAIQAKVHFDSIPCEFVSVSMQDYYGNAVEPDGPITLQSGFYRREYIPSLTPLSSEAVRVLNGFVSNAVDPSCIYPNGTKSAMACSSCSDYLRFYASLGYKTSKLILGLSLCSHYTVREFASDSASCDVTIPVRSPGIRFMVTADASRFSQFVSSGDFEDGSAETLLSKAIFISGLSVNQGSLHSAIPSPQPSASMAIQDYAISLIPKGLGANRHYEAKCRRSVIPIRVLGDEEVSGVQMVFDYSGIAKQQNGGDYLSVIVLCGGILSVMIGRECDLGSDA